MITKFRLFIYALVFGIVLSLSGGLYYMFTKVDDLTIANSALKIDVQAKELINQQFVTEMKDSRDEIALISGKLETLSVSVNNIDASTQKQTVELSLMKDRFKAFIAKPGLTEKLVNKDFSGLIDRTVCQTGGECK